MKKILLLIVIAVAAKFGWEAHKKKENPVVIENPVYGETRVKLGVAGREIEGVMFVKNANDAECRSTIGKFDGIIDKSSCEKVNCKIVSSECKPELTARNARLFDNEPTHVSYVSLARTRPELREMRFIVWGVSVAESDDLCKRIISGNALQIAKPTCIHAAR
ncbi:MAG: hypothetical protein REI94_06260 [Moraxellaceae bacterium]|nr:hypothetical protein [Moraxellaceae bacterium]